MTLRTAPEVRSGQALVLAGIVLVAVTLRSAVTSVSPLAGDLRADLGFGNAAIGLLGTLPVVCFAGFGALTPAIGRRFGLERTLIGSLALTVIGEATRPLTGGPTAFLLLSAVALAGMAMGNVLLPPLVKRYFPNRIGEVTGIYVVMISVGTAVPAYLAVPVADAVGWRWSLAGWAVAAAVAALPWLPHTRRAGPVAGLTEHRSVGVLRSPRAWGLTLMFGMTALNVYSLLAWLPSILEDAGLSTRQAGSMLGLLAAVAIPTSLGVPLIAGRIANPFWLVGGFALLFAIGYYGLLAHPADGTVWWVVAAGLGPSSFPLSLTIINLRTSTEVGSAALSGMGQGLGYALAGTGPLFVGILHQATGGWAASFTFLWATLLIMLAGAWLICRPGTLEAELAAQASPR